MEKVLDIPPELTLQLDLHFAENYNLQEYKTVFKSYMHMEFCICNETRPVFLKSCKTAEIDSECRDNLNTWRKLPLKLLDDIL